MSTNPKPAAHTPGPWRFYTEPQPNGCPIVGAKGLMVAMLAHSINYDDQRETAIANARLIAAAPELWVYAQCEEARTRGEDIAKTVLRRHGFDPRNGTAAFMDSMRRAAIAKATGGAQ